jgi:predicted nucleic acid-binding protein
MFLLDTNVLSELRKPRADAAVRAWAGRQSSVLFHISAMTVLEIEIGALLMLRRDARQGKVLQAWLENGVLGQFAGRIIPIDSNVARRCAALHVPNPRPERDAFIAATALVHGMTVVTRNTRDFQDAGVAVLNPWEASA